MNRKFVSAALTVTTLVWGLGMAVLPVAANAQTTASLQAQIAALLAQIQTLQGQLGSTSTSSTGSTTSGYSFTKDLTLGSKGADVTALQQLLVSKGFLKVAATGYFGSLTQAALGQFQAANGIAPAAGYFGPKTRAFVNSMSVSTTTTTTTTTTSGTPAGCTSSSGYSPTTGQSCATGTTTTTTSSVTPPATGLAVSMAYDNPMTGSLISSASTGPGAARVPVLSVNFTAGNSGAATLTGVVFHKTGVLSDSSIGGAYLTQNGKVISQYNSINNGAITFSGMNLQIPAGQTVELTLAIDVAGGLSAGNTVGFSLVGANDISSFDSSNTAINETGMFPLNGNSFTVTTVSNPSLATLTIQSSSIGTTVTAGTQGNLVGAWNFLGGNSKLWLKNLNFHVIGSANKGDIRNVKLMVNGVQMGVTLATVGQDGTAYFDGSASPAVLNTGANNVQVYADVMGSPNMNFQFEVLNAYDLTAVDSQYNVPVTVTNTGGIGTQVGIQTGQITLTEDQNSPTGNIAAGQSQVTLAKFDLYAAGEPVKVQFLDFKIALTGVVSSTGFTALSNFLKNISLTDDAGGQVGTTINTPPSSGISACAGLANNLADGANSTVFASSPTVTYADCFGSQSSPINYIVPANTTRVLSLKADVQSMTSPATFGTITASLAGNSNNLQGQISGQPNSTSQTSGNTLTLITSSLTVAQNNALAAQTIAANTTNQRISSYSFSASTAEGVNVNTVSIKLSPSTTTTYFANLKLMVNGQPWGTTQPTVAAGQTYAFSGSQFNVPKGGTISVDVYADTLSNAASVGVISPATSLTGCSATGQVSYTAISCSSVTGQNLTFGGATAIKISLDGNSAAASQVAMGTTQTNLATFDFQETSNIQNVSVTQLQITDVASTTIATTTLPAAMFSNLTLWAGSTQLGQVQAPNSTSSVVSTSTGSTISYNYLFNPNSNFVIPKSGTLVVTLKGDATGWAAGLLDATTHVFTVGTTKLTAQGALSGGGTVTPTGNATGTAQTTLRNVMVFSSVPVGLTSGRGKSVNDEVADLTFTPANGGSLYMSTATVTFAGTAASSTNFLAGVKLLDPSGNAITVASTSAACTSVATCTVTFAFNNRLLNGAQTFKLTADDSKEATAGSNSSVSLYVTVAQGADVSYIDAADGTGSATTLPTILQPGNQIFPINLNSVTYSQNT